MQPKHATGLLLGDFFQRARVQVELKLDTAGLVPLILKLWTLLDHVQRGVGVVSADACLVGDCCGGPLRRGCRHGTTAGGAVGGGGGTRQIRGLQQAAGRGKRQIGMFPVLCSREGVGGIKHHARHLLIVGPFWKHTSARARRQLVWRGGSTEKRTEKDRPSGCFWGGRGNHDCCTDGAVFVVHDATLFPLSRLGCSGGWDGGGVWTRGGKGSGKGRKAHQGPTGRCRLSCPHPRLCPIDAVNAFDGRDGVGTGRGSTNIANMAHAVHWTLLGAGRKESRRCRRHRRRWLWFVNTLRSRTCLGVPGSRGCLHSLGGCSQLCLHAVRAVDSCRLLPSVARIKCASLDQPALRAVPFLLLTDMITNEGVALWGLAHCLLLEATNNGLDRAALSRP